MKQIEKKTGLLWLEITAAAFILLIGTLLAPASQAEEMNLKLASDTINITTFYNGTTLTASGTVPADADVLVEVSGPKKNVALKVKGKVGGFLWMNKTDVELENTPAVYMVYTPEKLQTGLDKLGVGYQALVDNIAIEPESADKGFVFAEYVKLMEKAGVYGVNKGAITYGPADKGMKTYSLTLVIPPKMNAGDYMVRALACRQGTVIGRANQALQIRLTGLPKFIARLAFDHSLLFGIMAVVIAVAAGLIIGMLFKGGGGAH
jgi:uncharacterized protein (TIGR02186 family)